MPGWDDKEPSQIRYRLEDPSKFERMKTVTLPGGVGVSFIYGQVIGSNKWLKQALRFDKKKFTVAQAKAWLDKHPDMGKNSQDVGAMAAHIDAPVIEDHGDYVSVNSNFTADGLFSDWDGNMKYRSPDEVKKMVPLCNGLRVVINHPKVGVMEKHVASDLADREHPVIGWTSDAHFKEEGQLAKVAGKINIKKVGWNGQSNTDLIERIRTGAMKDNSIGFTYEKVPEAGDFQGKHYDFVERNINPYHLAILDGVPAAIPSPACGINERQGDKDMTEEDKSPEKGGSESSATPNLTSEKPIAVDAMSLKAIAAVNAEVKALVDEKAAQAKAIAEKDLKIKELDAKTTEGDKAKAAIAAIEKEKRDAKVKTLAEKMGDAFAKVFPEKAIEGVSDMELDRALMMVPASDTNAGKEMAGKPDPSLRIPSKGANGDVTPKYLDNDGATVGNRCYEPPKRRNTFEPTKPKA